MVQLQLCSQHPPGRRQASGIPVRISEIRRDRGEAGTDRPSPINTELAHTPVVVADGYATVPNRPGLGIELEESAVKRDSVGPTVNSLPLDRITSRIVYKTYPHLDDQRHDPWGRC